MCEVSLRQMPIGGKKEIIPISNKDFGRRGECNLNSIQIGLVSRLILVTCIGYAHDYFTTFNPVQRKLVHFRAKKTEQIDDRVKPAAEAHFRTGSKRDHKLHQRRKRTLRPHCPSVSPLVFQVEIELSHVLANLEASVFASFFFGVICSTCSVEKTINFDSEFVSHLSLFRSIPNKLKLASPQERSFGTFFLRGRAGAIFLLLGNPLIV